ncbi:hypothetical protein ACQ4PT_039011 [Festuca glaucescens]
MGSCHEIVTVRVSETDEFTIRQYSQIKGIGVGRPVLSERFTVAGRAWEFVAFYAEFAFQLLDPDDGSRVIYRCPSEGAWFDGFHSSWGVRRFISRKQLEGEALGALRGDSLMVRCTVRVFRAVGPSRSRDCPPPSPGIVEMPVPPSCFAENAVRFLASGRAPFDAVRLNVDGEVLDAHRLVLASQSPWFDRLLYGHWSSSDDTVVEIPALRRSSSCCTTSTMISCPKRHY